MPQIKQCTVKPVTWLSDVIKTEQNGSSTVCFYESFKFKNITASVGDYVLISNIDAALPDTEEGCDSAKLISLYENKGIRGDPFRAKVQWYSRPADLPTWCFNNIDPINFTDRELLEDHRPFSTDVSIETFFKKCHISLLYTHQDPNEAPKDKPYQYICRYRLIPVSKRKVNIEPVIEAERKALELLSTPVKNAQSSRASKSPSCLVRRMSRISLSEQKTWSINKTEGTKILLKRLKEKESPRKSANNTPTKAPGNVEIVSMELKENSYDELPTLVIRQHVPTTPKRKTPSRSLRGITPKKALDFDSNHKESPRRLSRTAKAQVCYIEDISPVKKTPKKYVKHQSMADGSDDDFAPKQTPKSLRTPQKTRSGVNTPRSVSRRIISHLTPTLHSRTHTVNNTVDYTNQNKSLPGRESQMDEILSFVRNKLLDGTSGCMYISGVPGTGKTATVCSSLQILKEEQGLPDFQLVEVNGMRITEPRQAYVQIHKQLTGKTVGWEQAYSLLDKRFTSPSPRRSPTVLLVDELDALCTRRQDVLYSIMEWAAHNSALLTVLAVANTMDLPERALAARVASRLGLTRLTFPPYTHTQLQKIVATRLVNANVTPDAVQLIARKVAAVSGDVRRALALCSRALELAGPEGAGLREVQRALSEASSGAVVTAIKHCSPAEKLLLRAVASEVERTGTDETTLSRALNATSAIIALDGRPYKSAPSNLTPSQAQAICARLASIRLLLMEPKASEPRLLLNVSVDDIHYATKQIAI